MVYNEINSDKEYKVLKYLENLLRKTIPKLQEIKHDSFGYKSKRGTVTGLGLASQGINVLPPSIVNLTNLKILTLSDNYRLKLLPQNIGELKNLKILNLRKNQLTELPESIGLLINLEELNLEGNRLEALPDSLCDLIYLRKLLLKNNYRLETFPKNLNKLVSLVEANITSFKLRDQLDKLVKKSKSEKTQPGKLTEETLDFDDSPEERLSIKEIKALEELEKMVGKIPEVEEIEWNTIGYQVEDGKVTGLGLAGKELTKLPTEIVNLESLEILDLNTNK
ncbi:MAG: leucine-rich repeat domain-containing protein, partial [Candidatus Heimdallarchaeota archaeon]|nr:leucine-rich repeat domain-containing protein [Candidatus Heimdallarchaeota archaeon]MCK5050042.1 leucine-rich repeat domain-containing protein [Candidatus Heimdallarchaeota archaeon]